MQNPMNNIMFNDIIQNPMNYLMYNNDMYQNPMDNSMYNGMYQKPMDNSINSCMISNPMNNSMYNGYYQNAVNNININNNNKINNIENIPIEKSIYLGSDNNEIVKYYLYPKIEFTEEEKNNSKFLLVIGQTGHGKTTFINTLINIYLGITINDNFRYLLVKDVENPLNSITNEITIYKIRPKQGLNFPPLIIIDTPGFSDTGGKEEDKENVKKF